MPAALQELVDAYLSAVSRGDVDAVMALYGDTPSVEDPVGSQPVVGREAIRAFYERAFAVPMTATPSGPAGIAAAAVAFPFPLDVAGGQMTIDIIDVFHVDDGGRIQSMRAYWGPTNTRG